MAVEAITYQSGPRAKDLRTVIVEDARRSVVLLPTGRIEIVQAKLLHGTSCRHSWWAEVLGTDPASDDFVVETSQIRQQREMKIAARVKRSK
jgi:hypothetical protein